MAFDVKQAIINRLRATKRKNIERVIDYMEQNGFFTAHCGRHHRYTGGLTSHSWQTYQIALRLNAERCANNPKAPVLDEDSIAIAALLHDLCDCSGLRDISGHGRRSARMLKTLGFKLTLEEFLAIRFHMRSHRSKGHFLYNDALNSPLAQLVYNSDRKSASLKRGSEI
jgi:23S rRNA maturation-related 3'-5' exoribonuclease YhaM